MSDDKTVKLTENAFDILEKLSIKTGQFKKKIVSRIIEERIDNDKKLRKEYEQTKKALEGL